MKHKTNSLASLKVELIHALADVVLEAGRLAADKLLVRADGGLAVRHVVTAVQKSSEMIVERYALMGAWLSCMSSLQNRNEVL